MHSQTTMYRLYVGDKIHHFGSEFKRIEKERKKIVTNFHSEIHIFHITSNHELRRIIQLYKIK